MRSHKQSDRSAFRATWIPEVALLALAAALTTSACSTGNRKPEPGAAPSTQQPSSDSGGAGGSAAPAPGTPANGGGAGGAPGAGGPATGGGVACGSKTCPAGQVCCNESCGICTPPGGFCTMQLCSPGETGGMGMGTPGAGTGACKQDGDCRIFSDYCTGCDCRALGKDDRDPACSGPGVRCLVDPCRDKVAVCRDGRCLTADKPRP